ncbi:MAG: hypothetical protein COU90_02845 [Candidatus Ryanbacteria bacterium CG10_big_fil_rev_8_21_14_0_10_43_42]|uniref:Uncharacterized protein n=1 Tax=Candidatus Ryanbacteria bacterium CG10_big_fil_rev_8_21_14_0_10_43_42 TaxID=1974864 RepID=A0A2M8KWQ3_9BACT|nr:MAG: hypothetical protein COU90_02845 [Candidatus Ryanbacteria bacterium CG10_big_fil_rev_8_21_14_0_10_43_42]
MEEEYEYATALNEDGFYPVYALYRVKGEYRLLWAILAEAIACLFDKNHPDASSEAREWINSEEDLWLGSFNNICEIFGINQSYLRKNLLQGQEDAVVSYISSRKKLFTT